MDVCSPSFEYSLEYEDDKNVMIVQSRFWTTREIMMIAPLVVLFSMDSCHETGYINNIRCFVN